MSDLAERLKEAYYAACEQSVGCGDMTQFWENMARWWEKYGKW